MCPTRLVISGGMPCSARTPLGWTSDFMIAIVVWLAGFRSALESGDADIMPQAAVNLGGVLVMQGDHQGAQRAFQLAVDSGRPEAVGAAALSLGALLAEAGDIEGARQMYQRAIACPISQVAEAARRRLTDLL